MKPQDLCQEALYWSQLDHQNVLPFLGLNTDLFKGRHCVVMPWMPNGTLLDFLESSSEANRISLVSDFVG
jgi:serine/threonine protein kinase